MSKCDESKAQSPAPAAESQRGGESPKATREARLAAALRANLRRRKAAAADEPR